MEACSWTCNVFISKIVTSQYFLSAADVRSRALLQSWPAYAPTPGEAPIYEYYPQPQLPYSYSAQEPYIDTRTQSIHWGIETKGGYDILNRLATANATLRVTSLPAAVTIPDRRSRTRSPVVDLCVREARHVWKPPKRLQTNTYPCAVEEN